MVGSSIPINFGMAWHAVVTFTVLSGGVNPNVRCHVSGQIAPLMPNTGGPTNTVPFEGDATVGIGVVRAFSVGVAFQTASGGQNVTAYRTKITMYGG
jgi:hypothetical protein